MRYTVEFESVKFDWGWDACHKIEMLGEDELLILDDFLGSYYDGETPDAQEIVDLVRFDLHCVRNSYDIVCGWDTIFLDGDDELQEYVKIHDDEFELGYVEIVF